MCYGEWSYGGIVEVSGSTRFWDSDMRSVRYKTKLPWSWGVVDKGLNNGLDIMCPL